MNYHKMDKKELIAELQQRDANWTPPLPVPKPWEIWTDDCGLKALVLEVSCGRVHWLNVTDIDECEIEDFYEFNARVVGKIDQKEPPDLEELIRLLHTQI